MDNLLLRRRMMMVVKEPEEEPEGGKLSDYVQSGLFLHLDGISKGSDVGKWTDLAGNKQFTAYGNVQFNSNHLYFDGNGDWLSYYSSSYGGTVPQATAGTVEVVFESELDGSTGVIFVPATSNRMAAILTSDRFVFFYDNTSARARQVPYVSETKASLSSTNSDCYVNGVAASFSSDKTYLNYGRTNYTYIGRRYNSTSGSNQFYFKGKIYSIRIYNRKLTQAEVLQNLSVDNIRFNLGLTLETT